MFKYVIKSSAVFIFAIFMVSCSPYKISNTIETEQIGKGIAAMMETATVTPKTTTAKTEVSTTLAPVTAITTAAPATTTTAPATTTTPATTADTEAAYIKSLYDDKQSDVWVTGKGTVTRILKDDNEGDRHQRFILELSTGQTLLFAHNIDIAPRVDDIKKGDIISFYGEYIYSDEGGTVHWTHHDPDGSSDGGWLKRGSETYK
jgi:hypothetical protein